MIVYLKHLFLLLLTATHFYGYSQNSVLQYISKHKHLAVQHMKNTHIPASVILGIAIVESAAGNSVVCKHFNNHFGIVGKNTSSQSKLGYQSVYREYTSTHASYLHFCQVLQKRKFYKELKSNMDYRLWIQALTKTSYASAKHIWADKIIETIINYRLYKFDIL